MLFLEGVKHGVAPLATDLGQHLPRVLPQWAVMLVAFALGVLSGVFCVAMSAALTDLFQRRCNTRKPAATPSHLESPHRRTPLAPPTP